MSKALAATVVLLCPVALAGCAGIVRDRIFQPIPISETPVEWRTSAPTAVTATTEDGLVLSGYYWAPRTSDRPLIVYFQGNSANQLVAAGNAEPFASKGAGVLVASYRGYGGNPGTPSEAGLARDADAWIAKAREFQPKAPPYLFGHSLGGAVALSAATRHAVAGVATLGTFSSMTAMVPAIARGSLRDRFDNTAAIARVSAPVWLYHGTADQTVPFVMAEQLRAAGAGRQVVLVPLAEGGHHVPMDRLAALVWRNFGEN